MRDRPLCTICLLLVFLLCGSVFIGKGRVVKELRPSPLETAAEEGEEILLTGQVYRKEKKEKYQVLYLKNNSITYQQQSLQETRLIIYDDTKEKVKIGNILRITGEVSFFEHARNPGNFDQKKYYQRQDIHACIWSRKLMVTDSSFSRWKEDISCFRQSWKEILCREMGERDGGTVSAMLLGEKAAMDPELKALYQANGIGHILAISGLHLSFIGVGLYQFFRRASGSFPAGALAGICFLTLYIVMIGMTVSALRAYVMFLFRVGADLAGRHYDGPTALSVSALIVLWWRPLSIFDGGFWLSFGAVFAVLAILPLFRNLPLQVLWASISINLMLLPVLLYFFFEIPLYSTLLNLFVIPLMSMLLLAGIAGSAVGCVLPGVGSFLLHICQWILMLYEKSCEWTLYLPGARLVIGKPQLWQVGIYYLCLLGAVWVWRRRKVHLTSIFLLLCAAMLLCTRFGERGKLAITVLDVGQGDGIFLRGPKGTAYFIDGGSSDVKKAGQYRIEPFLKSQGVGRLDYVLISHGDSDHMNGIEELLDRETIGVRIGTLVLPEEAVWDESLRTLTRKAVKKGVRVAVMSPGDTFSEDGMELTCVQPGEDFPAEPGNSASMVLALQYGDFDMLLTGDVEGEGEEILTETVQEDYAGTTWEVLKAAHHGSKNSSSKEILEVIKPQLALISAGVKNRYGHPHEETIERLEDIGSQIRSTKEQGAIQIESDGERYTIKTYLGK